MKKLILSLILLTGAIPGFSSQWIGINSSNPVAAKISLVSSDLVQSRVKKRVTHGNCRRPGSAKTHDIPGNP